MLQAAVLGVCPVQVTVNNQMVVGTLMNICDDPKRVSVYQQWREDDLVQRVPIIVTGNDLSHMFAPLVRDGRMTKFYWKPDSHDLCSILHQMYQVRPAALTIPLLFLLKPCCMALAVREICWPGQSSATCRGCLHWCDQQQFCLN